MEDAGLSQAELAAAAGITADELSRALSGERGFGLAEISVIARHCKADLHYLIMGEPDPYLAGLTNCGSAPA